MCPFDQHRRASGVGSWRHILPCLVHGLMGCSKVAMRESLGWSMPSMSLLANRSTLRRGASTKHVCIGSELLV